MTRIDAGAAAQANAFLCRYLDDLDRGTPRALDDYLAEFRGHEQVVSDLWRRIHHDADLDPAEGPATTAAAREQLTSVARQLRDDPVSLGAWLVAAAQAAMSPPLRPDEIPGYRLIEEIGRGGQGRVYLAEHLALRRRVAVKLLPPGARPEDLRRLRREGEIAARLDDPCLCQVYEVGELPHGAYVAMQLVAGPCLAARVAAAEGRGVVDVRAESERDAPASARALVDVVMAFVERMARALDRMHRAGVLHRDIKPSNVMLGEDGRPVLLDFGLARDERDATLTRPGDVLGTIDYMAPELLDARGAAHDVATEVWALGVMLFECLTGKRPFRAATRAGVAEAVRRAEVPLAELAGLPADLRAVVETALDRDRDRRYRDAHALAEDLGRLRRHEPVHARPMGTWLRLRRLAERRPVAATACLLGLLVVVLVPSVWALEAKAGERAVRAEMGRTREQRQRAERYLGRTLDAIEAMLVRVAEVDLDDLPRSTELRKRLLQDASSMYRDLDAEAAGVPGGWSAALELRVSRVETGLAQLAEEVGEFADARRLAASARTRLDALDAWSSNQLALQRAAVSASRQLGAACVRLGEIDSAIEQMSETTERVDASGQATAIGTAAMQLWQMLADAYRQHGAFPDSQRCLQRVIELADGVGDEGLLPGAWARTYLAEIQALGQDVGAAQSTLDEAERAAAGYLEREPGDRRARVLVGQLALQRSGLELRAGKPKAALERIRGALTEFDALASDYPRWRTLLWFRWQALVRNAVALGILRQPEAAEARAAVLRELDELDPETVDTGYALRNSIDLLVQLAYATRAVAADQAEEMLRRAIALGDVLRKRFPSATLGLVNLAIGNQILAELCEARGAVDDALAASRRGRELFEVLCATSSAQRFAADLARSRTQLAQRCIAAGRVDEGLAELATAMDEVLAARSRLPEAVLLARRGHAVAAAWTEAALARDDWETAVSVLERDLDSFLAAAAARKPKGAPAFWRRHPALASTASLTTPGGSVSPALRLRWARLVAALADAVGRDPVLRDADRSALRGELSQRGTALLAAAREGDDGGEVAGQIEADPVLRVLAPR